MSIIAKGNGPNKKGHGRQSLTRPIVSQPANTNCHATAQPTILLTEEPFSCGFDVGLEGPADGDRRGREFRDPLTALAYARLLRIELGGTIVGSPRCRRMSAREKLTCSAVPFSDHRNAALSLLTRAVHRDEELPPKVANFLGSCCGYRTLTPKMTWWLAKLLRNVDLPPVLDPSR